MDSSLKTGRPMRIAAIQFEQKPEDVTRVPEILEKGGFNTEQLLHAVGSDVYGLYEKEKHQELVRRYTADCKRRGIDVILYENVHIIQKDVFMQHPDWAQRDAGGTPAAAYGTYVFACVNSPWRDSFFKNLRDALEQDIVGIFLDGPVFIGPGCRCGHCRKLFLERFGHSIEQATRAELQDFKSEHVGRFVRDVRAVIRESGKDIALYANCQGLTVNVTGCTVDAIFPYVDLLGTEGGFLFYGNPNEVSIWRGSESAKYLESKAQGKPCVIFNAGNDQPWARQMLTAPETTLLYASTVANGANVWFGIHGLIDEFDTPAGEAAFRFNRFLAANEEYYTGTVPYAETALFWSQRTADCFPGDVAESDFTQSERSGAERTVGSFQKEFHGISDMLFRAHLPFAILSELDDGPLEPFSVLILPNACCLSDAEIAAVVRFVEKGGRLIATLESGRYDEHGNRRESSPLADLLGIRQVDRVETAAPGCAYLRYENGTGGGMAPSAGFTTGTLSCTYSDDCTVLASAYRPMEGRYSAFNEASYPCAVERAAGRGGAVYIAGGIGQTYQDYVIPEMKEFLTGLVRRFAPGGIRVEHAFPTVEVEMRSKPDQDLQLIHFVNHTGFMQRPIEQFIPCRGIEVFLKTEKPVKRVQTRFHPGQLPFEQLDGGIRFLVDVEAYELVVVEA